ncbi:MAG TPA: hypothetical protein VJ672_08480 [Gemmatimonadaceae bacterium]|nr:hypothetical protein [Gemmatimonadaceae bacterium]
MSSTRSRIMTAFAVTAIVGTLAACSDALTGPSITDRLSPQITDVNDPSLEGIAVLCKETEPDGATQSFSFNVSINGVPNANPTVLTDGQCVTLATSTKGSGEGTDRIDIQEVATTGWSVSNILLERFRLLVGGTADALDETAGTATVFINIDLGRRVTFTNTQDDVPTGNNGCTPGYWKAPQHFDSWTGYTTGQSFNTVFGIGTAWFPNSFTLLDALNANGGGTNALARHAVAALLNAAQGFYPQTEAQVIAAVQGVYPSGGIEALKNTLDTQNNLGCPLD